VMTAEERRIDEGRAARRSGWQIAIRENWYRDVWLFVITLCVLASMIFAYRSNRDRIADIQTSRLQTCERQNARHMHAVLVAQRSDVHNRDLVIALLDAIIPLQDCKLVVEPPGTNPGP
jgi:hypothetical protein